MWKTQKQNKFSNYISKIKLILTLIAYIANGQRSSSDKAYIFPSWHDCKT